MSTINKIWIGIKIAAVIIFAILSLLLLPKLIRRKDDEALEAIDDDIEDVNSKKKDENESVDALDDELDDLNSKLEESISVSDEVDEAVETIRRILKND